VAVIEKTTQLIARHEGLRLHPYVCSANKLSIGYGRNLDDVGISKAEAMSMLKTDVTQAFKDAHKFKWFRALDGVRRAVVVNMIFNLGFTRFNKFRKTLALIEKGHYTAASVEMLKGTGKGGRSKWANQVGPRADELSKMMSTGQWPNQ